VFKGLKVNRWCVASLG